MAFEPANLSLLLLASVGIVSCAGLMLTRFARLDASLVFGVCVIANVAATWVLQPRRDRTPYWNVDHCAAHWAKTRPTGVYLGVYPIGDLMSSRDRGRGYGGCLAPGNLSMLYERRFINGYSPLLLEGLHKTLDLHVHGELGVGGVRVALQTWAQPGSLLDRWGVTALVLPKADWFRSQAGRLAEVGWRAGEDVGDGSIWRRTQEAPKPALLEYVDRARFAPHVLRARSGLQLTGGTEWMFVPAKETTAKRDLEVVTYSPAKIELSAVTSTRVEARVKTSAGSAPALVIMRRPYYPGYRATFDGVPLEVGRADGVLVAVELPAGRDGQLVIEYAPWGTRGLALFAAAAALAVVLVGWGYEVIRQLRGRRVSAPG